MRVGDIVDVDVLESHESYALVRFGEYRGTLQLTELTWKVIHQPLRVDRFIGSKNKLRVLVIAVEDDRFSMSVKRLQEDPWNEPPKVGSKHIGTVSLVADYGWFVLLTDCFRGLLLKDKALSSYSEGDQIPVIVESCDLARRRIILIEDGVKEFEPAV